MKHYETPAIAVIEIEIEDAILSMSDQTTFIFDDVEYGGSAF